MTKKTKIAKAETSGESKLLDDIAKKYGNVIKKGDALLEERKDYKILKVSPIIDVALGGGIKEGSWVMLSGAAKSGKTTLAMQIAKNGQEEGRPIIYINAEGRLKEMNFEVEGLDPQGMQIITSEGPPLSAEVFLDITLKLLSAKENEGAICIIDSISSLIPARDLESEISGERRPGLPKILGDFVKKLGQIVPNQKSIVVMITHMITNTSGYGKAYMADGGVKIGYQADTRMEVKSISPWVQDDQQVGQAVNWKVLCSSIGPPGAECQSWIRYGNGIDKVQEVVMMGQEAGLITQAGAWFTCNFLLIKPEIVLRLNNDIKINDSGNYETPDDAALALKACKFQGGEALYNFVKSNQDVYEALIEAIEMMLC
jgi:recombination protein RecA